MFRVFSKKSYSIADLSKLIENISRSTSFKSGLSLPDFINHLSIDNYWKRGQIFKEIKENIENFNFYKKELIKINGHLVLKDTMPQEMRIITGNLIIEIENLIKELQSLQNNIDKFDLKNKALQNPLFYADMNYMDIKNTFIPKLNRTAQDITTLTLEIKKIL